MKLLKNANLLIISDRYPHRMDSMSLSFVKNQVDCIKNYFNKIYIISLTPFVPKILSNCSFMNPRWRRDAFAEDYKYDNVEVYFAKYKTLPFKKFRKSKGMVALNATNSIIIKKNINFDLIHAHFTYPSGYVGTKIKKIYNKPVILTVHENRDWFMEEISSNDENIVYAWKNVDKIIRVNKKDLEEFSRYDIDKSKIIYIPNGFSPQRFKTMNSDIARIKLGIPIDKKILLNIANLEEYKGQRYLIESMKEIQAIRKDVMLYIIGQGSLESDLQSMIDKNGFQDQIIIARGNKPIEEIPLWMNACDIFVLPSLSESFGIVQIEAMACGKPVVATYNGGSEEIVIDDKLGMLVEPSDTEGLARAILKALDAEWDAEYIRNYAEQFEMEKIVSRILEVYNEIPAK